MYIILGLLYGVKLPRIYDPRLIHFSLRFYAPFHAIPFQHFDECVGKLLFGLPARLPPHAQETIQPGNPLFLWDPGNGLILGIFRAVSGLSELVDRTAWARPGMDTPLPWQVCAPILLSCVSVFSGGGVTVWRHD